MKWIFFSWMNVMLELSVFVYCGRPGIILTVLRKIQDKSLFHSSLASFPDLATFSRVCSSMTCAISPGCRALVMKMPLNAAVESTSPDRRALRRSRRLH